MPVQADGPKPALADTPQKAAKRRVAELQGENTQLQEAVHAHAVVDQAIGVILAAGRLTPDQAGTSCAKSPSARTSNCGTSQN
ncbi:hypothetical protein ACFYRN_41150 [Streptomyces sp. NPDC005227]|uniref:hypothetical protein n=1 Tax=Streptomyces sp. NPDC005227 TaxID=3364707 RepID=UPI0036AC08B5